MEHISDYKKGSKKGGISEVHKKGTGIFIAVSEDEVKTFRSLKAADTWLQSQGYEPVKGA